MRRWESGTYVADTGTVICRSDMSHGKNKKNFEVFDAGAFIAAVTQHIPPKGFQMARYYGWYSNRARGERKKHGSLRPRDEPEGEQVEEILDVADHWPGRMASKTWRRSRLCSSSLNRCLFLNVRLHV